MSEYKRFTKRDECGNVWIECDDCYIQDKCDFTPESCCFEVQDRLAKLEDKIENGTLVELPCSLGEHFVIKDYGFGRFHVEKALIVGYNFLAHDNTIFPVDSYDDWYLPSRVFDTEEEAYAAKERLENM